MKKTFGDFWSGLTESDRKFAKRLLLALALGSLVFATRLLPHIADFTPMLAVGLFSGAYLSIGFALFASLAGIFASNIFLPGNSLIGSLIVVVAILFATISGRLIAKHVASDGISRKFVIVFGATISSSVMFFLITNCNFLYNGYANYALNLGGLLQSYIAGIPFFRAQILGDVVYSVVLFGVAEIAKAWSYSRKSLKSLS